MTLESKTVDTNLWGIADTNIQNIFILGQYVHIKLKIHNLFQYPQ